MSITSRRILPSSLRSISVCRCRTFGNRWTSSLTSELPQLVTLSTERVSLPCPAMKQSRSGGSSRAHAPRTTIRARRLITAEGTLYLELATVLSPQSNRHGMAPAPCPSRAYFVYDPEQPDSRDV